LASPSAGFLSPFRDSDLTTFCRVHSTGTREKSQRWKQRSEKNFWRVPPCPAGVATRSQSACFSDLRVFAGAPQPQWVSAGAPWACPAGRRRRRGTTARRRRGPRTRRRSRRRTSWRRSSIARHHPAREPARQTNQKLLSVSLTICIEQLQEQSQRRGIPPSDRSILTRLLLPK